MQVVWNRIILPDTSLLTLDNLADYAGLEDDVDWHWDRIFAGAALTTLLSVGAELAAPENSQDGDRVIIAGRVSVQYTLNKVGQEVTRRNPNIQPTLTERPGLPVRIIVNRDLVLRPYQPLFFNKGTSQRSFRTCWRRSWQGIGDLGRETQARLRILRSGGLRPDGLW